MFGIDGTKVNLPRPIMKDSCRMPGEDAHCPQGPVSCLYELMPRLPVDFGLHADTSERAAAILHLGALRAGDVVVCDRGCFSCRMLLAHLARGQDAVFRLKRNANARTVSFLAGCLPETVVEIRPDRRALARLKARHLGGAFGPLKLRLVRYSTGDTVFALGATLMEDDRVTVLQLAELCRVRWRIEEMHKTAKWFQAVEFLRATSDYGVLQELHVNFVMVTATRLMTNEIDREINASPDDRSPKRVNFRHAAAIFRNFEALALVQDDAVAEGVSRNVDDIAAFWQRERPGRSYPRVSFRPADKWAQRRRASATS